MQDWFFEQRDVILPEPLLSECYVHDSCPVNARRDHCDADEILITDFDTVTVL